MDKRDQTWGGEALFREGSTLGGGVNIGESLANNAEKELTGSD